MFKLLLVLIVCAIATTVMCLMIISFGQTLDPLWALFLFPFGVFGILFVTDHALLH